MENELGLKANRKYEDMQLGDVENTQSDNTNLVKWIGNYKETPLNIGIKNFASWYQKYYK